jgi:hypothetical protein
MGGTAEGITSGLQPRQGYKNPAGRVLPEDIARMKMSDIGGMDIGQLQKLSRSMSYKPQRKYGSDFWVDFGLNLASTPPAGNIVSTAALAAKDPFSRYTGAKREDQLSQYATESEMFKTMLGAQADVLAAERGEGMAGKTEQWKFEQVPKLINTISELESIPVDERTTEQQNDLDTAKINLGRLEKEDPFVGWFLQSDQSDKLFKKVKTELLQADQQSDEPIYTGEDDPQLWEDTYVEFRKRVKRMGKAEGGRIGYANAGAVMPGAMPMNQAAMPTDQGPALEDTAGITYEELRARLPQEITDDIVRLLANSAEALEDFAMIQTEQDINTFNKKYGVTLVLPSEG